ncbi:MAG: hypothetical protein LBH43_14980 [Treponema sp.]|jgi:hypothetical protein|nr:hypothetical protein [Treponema sp.]
MKKTLIACAALLLFIGCDILFGVEERKLKPYNPQKAGASIVGSFDIKYPCT